MIFGIKNAVFLAALYVAPAALNAQVDFKLFDRTFQVHGFASQGFAYSGQNNYLTMKTSTGSFAMTDGGVTVSSQLTDKFRVGAQIYDRNVGELGKWRPQLDWAYGDYKFKDWFGVRAGKVKTALGLFNDTQDMEFLHTWAVLPQAVYPVDLRANVIAHTGADMYGTVSLHKLGALNYTAYVGTRTNDPRGGYYLATADAGLAIKEFSGIVGGWDARWNTPIEGLMIGGSWLNQTENINGTIAPYGNAPIQISDDFEQTTAVYADYMRGKWHFNGEFRRNKNVLDISLLGARSQADAGDKGWFVSAAYHVTKKLEMGVYNSRYYVNIPTTPIPAGDHIFDQAVTARYDITRFWNVKVEGHFIDGYGDLYSAHGFYLGSNPQGLKPTTNMLVIRTGFNF